MNITEREIDDPEKEGVILEYVNFTKEGILRWILSRIGLKQR